MVTRKYNGENYTRTNIFVHKEDARDYKFGATKTGKYVRVVKEKFKTQLGSKVGYSVWERSK